MPYVELDDARLHVEVDGEGEPVTVLAHGLTNTCRELARLTPLVPGTKIRFCFRGHGHSTSPAAGLDRPVREKDRFIRTAELLETKPRDEAIDAILSDPERLAVYERFPAMREMDRATWDHADLQALATAIREVIEDHPIPHREL